MMTARNRSISFNARRAVKSTQDRRFNAFLIGETMISKFSLQIFFFGLQEFDLQA